MANSRYETPRRSSRSSLSGGSARSSRSGTGYTLRSHNIRFSASTGSSLRDKLMRLDRRTILVLAGALVVLIIAVLGISSCVRGCTATKEEEVIVNEQDGRVAPEASSEITTLLTPQLNLGERYNQLAQQADRYEDARLIQLAIDEPSALELVLAYPDLVDPENEDAAISQPFNEPITQGVVVRLYCWDIRWGAVEYNGGPLALTGNGPAALASAVMTVTGSTEFTPADIAEKVTASQSTGGDTGMLSSFITNNASDLGITSQFYEPGIDNLRALLAQGTMVLADAKAGVLGDSPHWIFITSLNDDGSVSLFDPTSTENSSHTWSIGTIGTGVGTLYSIAAAPQTTTE